MRTAGNHLRVVCAVLRDGDKFLSVQRPQGKHMAGFWEFPGGKIEENESETDPIIREIREELGCEILPGRRLTPSVTDYGAKVVELSPYECAVARGTVVLKEHSALAWLTPDAFQTVEWCPADLPILEQLK